MKKTRLLVVAIVLMLCSIAMPLSASAGEATDLLRNVQATLAEAPSISINMGIGMGIKLGESDLEFGILSEIVIVRDPIQLKMVMDRSELGMETNEIYVISEEEGYVKYENESGTWTKTELTSEEAAEFINVKANSTDLLLTFGEEIETAEMLPDEKIGDIDCKVVRQMLSGERLVMLAQSQSTDIAGGLSDEQLASIAQSMDETEALYYIDAQSGNLVRLSLDMSDAYQKMITVIASGSGEDGIESLLSMAPVTKMQLVIDVIGIGDVNYIEVPAEALL